MIMVHILFNIKVSTNLTAVLIDMEFIKVFTSDVMAAVHAISHLVRAIDRFIRFCIAYGLLRVEEYKGVDTNKTKDGSMPNWGQAKGMNTQTKQEEPKKRRKEDEPDGAVSTAVQYLKNSFLPTTERIKADDKYEADQKRKKEAAEKNK